jgi:tRNA G18 (ribose-2'-O)-methylase SpoU
MNLIPIHDLADPRLAPYANMRDAELAQRADPRDEDAHGGLFIAEGELVVRRLLSSRFDLHSVLTTPTRLESLRPDLESKAGNAPIFLAPPDLLNSIVGFNMHRGLLAIGRRGPDLSLADLLARPGPLIVLEDLTNHDNLGGIFRNAAALGGAGVGALLSPRCADPLYRKSLRVSMGCALAVPFARAANWPNDLGTLAAAGFEAWALTPHPDAEPLHTTQPETRVALVLGTAGAGLTDAAMAACRRRVRIEMNRVDPIVDSLNVAMAAGIALSWLAHRTKSK